MGIILTQTDRIYMHTLQTKHTHLPRSSRASSLHPSSFSHTIMRTVGDKVKRSTDLISFAAFVWLIGDGEDVRRDAMQAIHEYKVEVESA
jgi:hypothetical protein